MMMTKMMKRQLLNSVQKEQGDKLGKKASRKERKDRELVNLTVMANNTTLGFLFPSFFLTTFTAFTALFADTFNAGSIVKTINRITRVQATGCGYW